MTAVTYDVGRHGAILSTRDRGRRALRDLDDHTTPGISRLVLDFTGVDAMTVSYADEFLGNYYASLTTQDRSPSAVLLAGLNDDTRETITVCLERRDLIAVEQRDTLALLAAPDVLNDTYRLATTLGTFTAATLAERLCITAQNANNRLKRLVAARALTRTLGTAARGGKEFTYTAPTTVGKAKTG